MGGGFSDIKANGNGPGRLLVTIKSTDVAFETRGCGSWAQVVGAPSSAPAPAPAPSSAPAPAPAPAAGVPWPGTSLSTAYHGQYRTDVVMVQRRLNQLGYGPMPVDGDYGPVTASWVTQYQTDHGLVVDGVVGPQTGNSLFGG